MNKTLKAADDAKKLAKMFQSLNDVAEALEKIGSAEQAENEARARIDALRKEGDDLVALLTDKREMAKGIVAKAEAKAHEILTSAYADADVARDQAKADARAVIDEATAARDHAQGHLLETSAQLVDLKDQIDAAKAELEALNMESEKVRAFLATIKGA